jgi:hypothetical protein
LIYVLYSLPAGHAHATSVDSSPIIVDPMVLSQYFHTPLPALIARFYHLNASNLSFRR